MKIGKCRGEVRGSHSSLDGRAVGAAAHEERDHERIYMLLQSVMDFLVKSHHGHSALLCTEDVAV